MKSLFCFLIAMSAATSAFAISPVADEYEDQTTGIYYSVNPGESCDLSAAKAAKAYSENGYIVTKVSCTADGRYYQITFKKIVR